MLAGVTFWGITAIFFLFQRYNIAKWKHVNSLKYCYQYNFIHPKLRNVSADDENWENGLSYCDTGNSSEFITSYTVFALKALVLGVMCLSETHTFFLSSCMSVTFFFGCKIEKFEVTSQFTKTQKWEGRCADLWVLCVCECARWF